MSVELRTEPQPGETSPSGERLRVLAITHRVPFPPDKGDKIRTWHLLSRLAQRAEVHLLCFADPPDDLRHVDRLRSAFASVEAFPLDMRRQKLAALPWLATRQPMTVPCYHATAMDRAVDARVATVRPHAIYAESSSMAPYALRHPDVPLVMDFVDVDSEKWRSLAQRGSIASRLVHAREAWTLARFERHVARHARISAITAPRELALFQRVAPGARGTVLANGVDTDAFRPRASTPDAPSLVFFGAMDYVANVDAARYLVDVVLPRVRDAMPATTVVLAGSKPTREVQALARTAGVTVTGFVDDIRPYVQGAMISVCPLRVARGVQNKVLEAMAMGVPVLASPAAAEGIDGEPGRHLVVARDDDDGRAMADAIVSLLRDRARCESIAREARTLVVERYGWQPRSDELFTMLATAAGFDARYSVRR